MKKIQLGDYNLLKVVKRSDYGMYLDGGTDGEILMPKKYVPHGCKIGDELEVFVYLDNEERPVATTEEPLARVGDFAYLEVGWVNEYGAFLKWGIMKDLFCPFREQKRKMQVGENYIVHIYVDDESNRLAASAKIDKFLCKDFPPFNHGDEVDLLIWQKTDLGFKVIINNMYGGLIYDDQIFRGLHTGDRMKGYINVVRSDGKIDVTLQPTGQKQTKEFADELLDYLNSHDGVCMYGDKSDADEIRECFKVSKKTFKKAVGDLYKKKIIEIVNDKEIRLIKE